MVALRVRASPFEETHHTPPRTCRGFGPRWNVVTRFQGVHEGPRRLRSSLRILFQAGEDEGCERLWNGSAEPEGGRHGLRVQMVAADFHYGAALEHTLTREQVVADASQGIQVAARIDTFRLRDGLGGQIMRGPGDPVPEREIGIPIQ